MQNSDFFMSLFATFAGVFLAFLLDRIVFRSESIRKKKSDKTKLKIALLSIVRSIEYNKKHYVSLSNTFKAKSIKVVLPTDTFTWDAYKGDVFLFLKDLSLRNELIYYFLVADTVKYLSDSFYILYGQKFGNNFNNQEWEKYYGEQREDVARFCTEILSLGDNLTQKLKRTILEL